MKFVIVFALLFIIGAIYAAPSATLDETSADPTTDSDLNPSTENPNKTIGGNSKICTQNLSESYQTLFAAVKYGNGGAARLAAKQIRDEVHKLEPRGDAAAKVREIYKFTLAHAFPWDSFANILRTVNKACKFGEEPTNENLNLGNPDEIKAGGIKCTENYKKLYLQFASAARFQDARAHEYLKEISKELNSQSEAGQSRAAFQIDQLIEDMKRFTSKGIEYIIFFPEAQQILDVCTFGSEKPDPEQISAPEYVDYH